MMIEAPLARDALVRQCRSASGAEAERSASLPASPRGHCRDMAYRGNMKKRLSRANAAAQVCADHRR
jgi:hypothetical protein